MAAAFEELFGDAREAFGDDSVFERAQALALAWLVALGRHTVTGALTTCGRQFEDWSAAYRLFERGRFDSGKLFAAPRRAATRLLGPAAPLVAVADDTLVRKRGRKVARTAWRHDPLGPRFQHQIAWGQRALEISAIVPPRDGAAQGARAVPIDLVVQKTPAKPGKRAGAAELAAHRQATKQAALPGVCAQRAAALRSALDADGEARREIIFAFDGGYTNRAMFRNIPERTTFVGRARKDALLFAPPEAQPVGRGRRRIYGQQLQRPQELLRDERTPWREASVFAAGKQRVFQYKTIDRCRWRGAGERDLRLIVVRPLSSQPHQAGRRLFFAHPGYLLVSNPDIPIQDVLQAYVWRWEIEVGFREQKTQLGLGEAQTRTDTACACVLQFQAFTYALALLAAARADIETLPRPRWQKPGGDRQRITFGQIIGLLRADLWGRALGLGNKTDFAPKTPRRTNPQKIQNSLDSAVLYAVN